MGCRNNITHNTFPKQGSFLGQNVNVCFHYDTNNIIKGKCIRDDVEEPSLTIFQLENGRVVLSTECQYS